MAQASARRYPQRSKIIRDPKTKGIEPAAPIDTPNAKNEGSSNKKPRVTKKAKTPAAKSAAKKAPEGKNAAEQLYKKIIASVDKKVSSLDAQVKKNGPNSAAITSDHYADTMVKFIKDIEKLMAMGPDGARYAFNAILYIGPHAHGDLEASWKMSGYGGTEGPFAELDDIMCDIIGLREDLDCAGKDDGVELLEVRHRWTIKDAEVGVFKTGRPNKQQRGQIERQKATWIKERFEEARKRREAAQDWIANAIQELTEEGTDIERYGLERYFKKSLARLEELRGGDPVSKAAGDV
jgi:hypothetical protein